MSAIWIGLKLLMFATGVLCWVSALVFTAIIVASELRASAQRKRTAATRRNIVDAVEAARYRYSRQGQPS